MPKLTLDMAAFKALASDTRLSILRALDGKKLNLKELCKVTELNKATLHEHLVKLNEAGLVKKKEREGHKWVYYKLTWKGEGLLHPENTKIVVMFSTTFVSLLIAVVLIASFLQPIPVGYAETVDDTVFLYELEEGGNSIFGGSYSANYLGELDARNKKVMNITTDFQTLAPVKNIAGEKYKDEDIVWVKAESSDNAKDAVCSIDYSEEFKSSETSPAPSVAFDYCLSSHTIQNSQVLLNPLYDLGFSINASQTNESDSESRGNDIDNSSDESEPDNDTINESYLTLGENEGFSNFYPAVPKMIATVQDPVLLYLAVACLIFFGVLFSLSSWRFLVNRKPRL